MGIELNGVHRLGNRVVYYDKSCPLVTLVGDAVILNDNGRTSGSVRNQMKKGLLKLLGVRIDVSAAGPKHQEAHAVKVGSCVLRFSGKLEIDRKDLTRE